MYSDNIIDNMFYEFFGEATEKNDKDIPDVIEPTVKVLEGKGYQVKYASPGHLNTKFDNDRDKDSVINGKFASTARIVFARNYKFSNTPQNWEWKVLHNGTKALYVKPYSYNDEKGTEHELFVKWQTSYIDSLYTWARSLPKAGEDDKKSAPDKNFYK